MIYLGNITPDTMSFGGQGFDEAYFRGYKVYPTSVTPTGSTFTYNVTYEIQEGDAGDHGFPVYIKIFNGSLEYISRVIDWKGNDVTDSVKSSGRYTFDTPGIWSFSITLTGTTIPKDAFWCYPLHQTGVSVTKSVSIPNGVTSIEYDAFWRCKRMTSISLPNTIETIKSGAFEYSGIEEIIIPSSVTSIGYISFANCHELQNVVIGENISNIGLYAFHHCDSLDSVTILNTTPPTIDGFAFVGDYPIYVPSSSVDTYKASWTQYASRIQAIPE